MTPSGSMFHPLRTQGGGRAAQKAAAFVAALKLGEDGGTLPPHHLGRLRDEIRDHLGAALIKTPSAKSRIFSVGKAQGKHWAKLY